MNEVVDFERDIRKAKQGEALIYTKLHGLEADLSKPKDAPDFPQIPTLDKQNESDEEDSDDDDSYEDDSDEDDSDQDDEEGEHEPTEQDLEKMELKKKKLEMYTRPRDESPNSKRVSFDLSIDRSRNRLIELKSFRKESWLSKWSSARNEPRKRPNTSRSVPSKFPRSRSTNRQLSTVILFGTVSTCNFLSNKVTN